MLKQVYRILILIIVFIASILYFSRDIKEVVFDIKNTTTMEETTFPLVTIRSEGEELNRLYGYSSNLNANKIWEGVTPLSLDQSFEVIVNQESYDIKKLNYEVREFSDNKLIESESVSVFEENDGHKIAKLKIKTKLENDKDYAVKLTLITSESKKINYYQRVKTSENAYLGEKLSFVREFHNALKDKETAGWITDRLEINRNKDNTTLAHVNINSSFDLVTWGNIEPVFLTEVIPTITEINRSFASVRLDYIIEADIAGATEKFRVQEFYRVQYTNNKSYLLNYDRTMEALFDVNRTSISMSQLKLGITNDTEVPYLSSQDRKKLAFVRDRELWYYNLELNEIVRVFSFREKGSDYLRDLYNQHDVRILNMDAEGNIDFLVYGYMNRGQYEGKVAVILYEYIMADNRIEEKVYIPVEEPYQTLKENIGELAYVNALDEFYLHIYDHIYCYNLITRQVAELAKGVKQKQVAYFKDKSYVAWQGNSDPSQSKEIKIMNLETDEIQTIYTRAGYNILLMDKIDSNLVYGFATEEDMTTLVDGRVIVPMKMIEIATLDKEIRKSYHIEGYYIKDLIVKGNIIELYRVQRKVESGRIDYIDVSQDYIMNQNKPETPLVTVTSRVTEQALTEYYMTLPSGFSLTELPKITAAVHTVISVDPTLRIPELSLEKQLYYAYIGGELYGTYEEVYEAILAVKERVGVVKDSNRRLVWEQGVKPLKSVISRFDRQSIQKTDRSLEACVTILLSDMGRVVDPAQIDLSKKSIYEILYEEKQEPISLTGVQLEDVLYYVSQGKPVIAKTSSNSAVLIYGYDTFNIQVIDPGLGKARKIGLQDSKDMFEKAGNIYISYLDQ